jgi:hypothetical protein
VYGLGYSLLLFVYSKLDDVQNQVANLQFLHCALIDKSRTADYQTTLGLRGILERKGNHDDVVAFLTERNLPGDDATLNLLADEILQNPPELGYITISNALQWRLQYSRVVSLTQAVSGVTKIV